MKFKMVPETLYATINYIDRYLTLREVRRSRLQLVGVSALLVRIHYIHYHIAVSNLLYTFSYVN